MEAIIAAAQATARNLFLFINVSSFF